MTEDSVQLILRRLEELDTNTTKRFELLEVNVGKLEANFEKLEANFEKLEANVEKMERQQEISNVIVQTYQKGSQQVVNLAFGLIATAAGTIVLQAVLAQHS